MEKQYVSVFKIDRHTGEVKVKSFEQFNSVNHNSDCENFYYFNFNHISGLWEHSYCQCLTDEVKDSFNRAKIKKLIIDVLIMYGDDLTLIARLEEELKQIPVINERERAKARYERSMGRLKDSFPGKVKEIGKVSSIRA